MTNADIVRAWYREHLSSGAIARDTPAYNQLVEALPKLIARLDAAAKPAPARVKVAAPAKANAKVLAAPAAAATPSTHSTPSTPATPAVSVGAKTVARADDAKPV